MRIAYLHQYFKFPEENGGTRSYDLAKSFMNNGYDVTIITTTSNKDFKHYNGWFTVTKEGINVNYIYLPYDNNFSYSKRIIVFLKFIILSSFKLLRLKVDLILATSTPLTIGLVALIKKYIHKTPYIFEVRDVWPEAVIAIGAIKNKWIQKFLYFLEKLIYKNAEVIVPLSSDMQYSINSRYPEFKNKAKTVIENISEINRFQEVNSNIDLKDKIGFYPRFTILYAGSFGEVNRIDKIVEYAKRTLSIDKYLVYIIIGEGAQKAKVRELAKQEKVLNKNLFIFDSVSKDELPSWYFSASMGSSFVNNIPELWANSANKFFDTLAAGKPILINYKGWQSQIIKKYNIGYNIPFSMDDKEAIDFVKYTKDLNLVHHQSINALALAKEKYSLEVATDRYLHILNKILT